MVVHENEQRNHRGPAPVHGACTRRSSRARSASGSQPIVEALGNRLGDRQPRCSRSARTCATARPAARRSAISTSPACAARRCSGRCSSSPSRSAGCRHSSTTPQRSSTAPRPPTWRREPGVAGSGGGGRIATVGAVLGLCLGGASVGTVCVVTDRVPILGSDLPARQASRAEPKAKIETRHGGLRPSRPTVLPVATVTHRPRAARQVSAESSRSAPYISGRKRKQSRRRRRQRSASTAHARQTSRPLRTSSASRNQAAAPTHGHRRCARRASDHHPLTQPSPSNSRPATDKDPEPRRSSAQPSRSLPRDVPLLRAFVARLLLLPPDLDGAAIRHAGPAARSSSLVALLLGCSASSAARRRVRGRDLRGRPAELQHPRVHALGDSSHDYQARV